MKRKVSGLLWLTLLVVFDQVTKIIAKTQLEGKEGFSVIKNIFQFTYHENRGMGFGMLQGKIWLFIIFTIIVLSCVIYIYCKLPDGKRYIPMYWLLITLSAGAIGNFIDRVFRGYVIDFLYFELIDFPVFNVADMYVTISCFTFLALFIFYYKEEDIEFLSRKKH